MAANDDAKELKSLVEQWKSVTKQLNNELKETKTLAAESMSPFESLIGIFDELEKHKSRENQLSSDQLKLLSERVRLEKKNLDDSKKALDQRLGALAREEEAKKQILRTNSRTSEAYKEAQKALRGIQSEINANNDAQDDLNKKIENTAAEVEDLEKALKQATQAAKGFEVLDKVGQSLDKINTPLSGMLNPLQLLNDVIGFVVGTVKNLDTELGDAAKSMNMTYEAAGRSRIEMTRFAKATGDTLVNSTHLQESVLAINESLGSNVAFEQMTESFQKDVTFLSKMSHYAGLTADEANSIAKLTLATGQSAEDFTGELMAQTKLSGMQKGLVLNEKTALKEISKTSAAIKMSFHGSAKGLGDAYAKAKALGTSLDKVDDIAGSILNFEESIESELSAELLTGKQLNLEKAREAALNNDIATVAEEIAKNVGSAADFANMNRIQQDAIAKSVGMTREDLAASLQEQESLKAIGAASVEDAKAQYDKLRETMTAEEAMVALKDEQLAKQFEQQNVQDKLGAAQLTMADSMNKTLIPALTTINENFNDMWNQIKAIIEKLGGMKTILVIMGTIMAAKLVKGIVDFASGTKQAISVAKSLFAVEKKEAAVNVVGDSYKMAAGLGPLGIAAVGGLIGAGLAALAMYTMNDGIISPSTGGSGYGSRMLFGPEGAISFNNKDTIVAGTDLFKANDMVSAPKGGVTVGGGGSSKEIAELKGAIMALAARPVNVAIDGKKVIEATTGANPNTQGAESAKNSFKMQ